MSKENPRKNRIKDLPEDQRPRERLITKGPKNLKDEELLAKIYEIINKNL